MRISLVSFVFLLCCNSTLFAQSELPSCFHSASDQDGDGFGYENSMSCVVDETTRSVFEPNLCIDENGDGYGWDGLKTCVVEVAVNPDCEDTDPVGDGWGWNGSQSCTVVAQVPDAISELELLKDRLIDVDDRDKSAVFYCPSTDETVRLNIYSTAYFYIGEDYIGDGMWSTGLYDKDNIVWVKFNGRRRAFGFQEQGIIFGSVRCDWLSD